MDSQSRPEMVRGARASVLRSALCYPHRADYAATRSGFAPPDLPADRRQTAAPRPLETRPCVRSGSACLPLARCATAHRWCSRSLALRERGRSVPAQTATRPVGSDVAVPMHQAPSSHDVRADDRTDSRGSVPAGIQLLLEEQLAPAIVSHDGG